MITSQDVKALKWAVREAALQREAAANQLLPMQNKAFDEQMKKARAAIRKIAAFYRGRVIQ